MSAAGEIVHVEGIDVDATKIIVGLVLTHTNNGKRVQVLVPAGRGDDYIARFRVMISRTRVEIRNAGKTERQFKFRATKYPYTKDGKRFDAVLMWQEQTLVHQMITELVRGGL